MRPRATLARGLGVSMRNSVSGRTVAAGTGQACRSDVAPAADHTAMSALLPPRAGTWAGTWPRCSWIDWIAMAPRPTADATRLTPR